MTVTPLLNIEIEKWGFNSILIKVEDGVQICTRSVQYTDYQYKANNSFVDDSHLKLLH